MSERKPVDTLDFLIDLLGLFDSVLRLASFSPEDKQRMVVNNVAIIAE